MDDATDEQDIVDKRCNFAHNSNYSNYLSLLVLYKLSETVNLYAMDGVLKIRYSSILS